MEETTGGTRVEHGEEGNSPPPYSFLEGAANLMTEDTQHFLVSIIVFSAVVLVAYFIYVFYQWRVILKYIHNGRRYIHNTFKEFVAHYKANPTRYEIYNTLYHDQVATMIDPSYHLESMPDDWARDNEKALIWIRFSYFDYFKFRIWAKIAKSAAWSSAKTNLSEKEYSRIMNIIVDDFENKEP